MVAVFNKELLSWYLITLKLNQTVETGLQNPTTSRPIDLPDTNHAKTQETRFPLPPNSLQIPITEDETGPPKPEEPDWVITIKEKLVQAQQEDAARTWAKLSIYRIPQCLREGDDNRAYIPQIVSLGPYHHGKKRLRNMDRHKWRALHRVLTRTNHPVGLYFDAVRELEERARACYEGSVPLGSNENDPIFAMRATMHSIQRDMIMLENQIPLFVLETLFGLQSGQEDRAGTVTRLALRSRIESSARFDPLTEQGGLHCLDVFRRSLLSIQAGPKPAPRVWIKRWSHANRVADRRRQQLIHCVSELKDAGIKFKKRKTDRFWDIKFENGVLKIPRLLIHDGTKSLFLNLIALEQCHLDCTNDITSYVIFMDNLIDSPADVSYLHYCGIIENWLGSDAEVANIFNRLCQEVVFDINDSSLSRLSEQVNRYYEHRWNAWRASLKNKYFNNPWSIISFLAAVVLLALTLAQTFYGVHGFYNPHQ
ncbi:Plant protein of unknown function (DUF247 [Striga hermonthica]|uniref:Uncharacterized protein n=1 Tax=Striga hermonthica TaxID=68872 RepID=A0A9N7NX48_STRHE|nr:Plant protein of unknown function (DUF247 [Striga hermonthica]